MVNYSLSWSPSRQPRSLTPPSLGQLSSSQATALAVGGAFVGAFVLGALALPKRYQWTKVALWGAAGATIASTVVQLVAKA